MRWQQLQQQQSRWAGELEPLASGREGAEPARPGGAAFPPNDSASEPPAAPERTWLLTSPRALPSPSKAVAWFPRKDAAQSRPIYSSFQGNGMKKKGAGTTEEKAEGALLLALHLAKNPFPKNHSPSDWNGRGSDGCFRLGQKEMLIGCWAGRVWKGVGNIHLNPIGRKRGVAW